MNEKLQGIIGDNAAKLARGELPPWKVEQEIADRYGVAPPANFRLAALSRRRFIENTTGETFAFIGLPKKPFKIHYKCAQCRFEWELDADDTNHVCSICGKKLTPLPRYGPLVSNYVGGSEAYYSFAGSIQVKGDINKTFTNLLVYGTGLGPIGVTRGCHYLNRFGGAEVRVSECGRAARCIGYIFATEGERRRAVEMIRSQLEPIKTEMVSLLEEFSGRLNAVEFEPAESQDGYALFVDFAAEFSNARGHGSLSRAVGLAKRRCQEILLKNGLDSKLSIIAQGYDGDLKPSPRNKRGRYASAEVRVPVKEFKKELKVDPDKFISFVHLDALGARKLGCQFYSGMGGEIVPAVYKATRVNPQSPLVSSFENISVKTDRGDVVYAVELPNVEVGIASSAEGIISPSAREALRIMGVRNAREFAASLAAQVLAGEFNLALEISRENLYKS
jgi:DNA-directed RNA polymerase subunit RPC12/RpoP